MFKVLSSSDYCNGLVDHFMEFTYQESTRENFEDLYLKAIESKSEEADTVEYEKMILDYYTFIESFLNSEDENQFIAVFEKNSSYVSALRAIEIQKGIWLEEALETAIEHRRCGYSTELVKGLIEFLKEKKGKFIVANIARSNTESRDFHKKLGFIETDKPVVDDSGIVYKRQIRYEYKIY